MGKWDQITHGGAGLGAVNLWMNSPGGMLIPNMNSVYFCVFDVFCQYWKLLECPFNFSEQKKQCENTDSKNTALLYEIYTSSGSVCLCVIWSRWGSGWSPVTAGCWPGQHTGGSCWIWGNTQGWSLGVSTAGRTAHKTHNIKWLYDCINIWISF